MNLSPISKIYDTSCSICLEEYTKDQPNQCLLLKCGHIFHQECVQSWLDKYNSCPNCREKIFSHLSLKELLKKGMVGGLNLAGQTAVVISTAVFYSYVAFDDVANRMTVEAVKLMDTDNIPEVNSNVILIGFSLGIGILSAGYFIAKRIRQPQPNSTIQINYQPPSLN